MEPALKGKLQREMINTEEVLAYIYLLNEKWHDEEYQPNQDDIFIGSLDAEALYPSLDTERVSKLCGEILVESGLKIENVD